MQPNFIENQACPCGSPNSYTNCCSRFHAELTVAENAEILMRSRYCAYVVLNEAYLLKTWHETTRPVSMDFSGQNPIWKSLQIVQTKKGQAGDSTGVVEFKAFYEQFGEDYVLHELSRFIKVDGCWQYKDGTIKFSGKIASK